MKFRILEEAGTYWPQVKADKWCSMWKGVPVRLHTFDDRYVCYASTEQQARDAIEKYKQVGDISQTKVISVDSYV